MVMIAWIVLAFTALRLLVVLANLLGRQWLKKEKLQEQKLVSVLIPARNEEKNIGRLLKLLTYHDYEQLEILVYDDLSEDHTAAVVQEFSDADNRIRLLSGQGLPAGWLGKNHACHRLVQEARGEYLLFMDADVLPGKGLVKNALAHMQRHKLKLLSLFPVQRMESMPERLVVPLMNWILLSLLPLVLTRVSARASLSAANGQFMMFEAKTYREHLFHQKLRTHKVEDIAIFRQMKRMGFRVQTLLGNNSISCRMYSTGGEAINGFSKNVFEFFGGQVWLAFVFGIVTTFGIVAVWMALPIFHVWMYIGMVVLLRFSVSLASRQSVIINLLLAPMQQLAFLYLLIYAARLQNKKSTLWKGRNIDHLAN